MKWLWNWSKPKVSSVIDNDQLTSIRNDLATLQNNLNSIQSSLSNYLTSNQSYSLTNQTDKFIINVASSANYLELQRGGNRKTTMGLGSSSSDNFSIESTGNILLKPNQYLDMNAKPIQNVANPTQNNQVATKQYVDRLTTTNTNSINGLTTRVTNLENATSSYLYVVKATISLSGSIVGSINSPFVKEYVLGGANSQVSYPSNVSQSDIDNSLLVSVIPCGIYFNNTIDKTIPFVTTTYGTNDTMGASKFLLTIFNVNNSNGKMSIKFLISSSTPLNVVSVINEVSKSNSNEIVIDSIMEV